MSYHGKLQTLKNGTADAEIQQWAYQQLEKETVELTDEEIKITTITDVLNYFEEARYELDADFVFKLKKHFRICGE